MRIVIDCRLLSHGAKERRGEGRFIRGLLSGLSRVGHDHDILLLGPPAGITCKEAGAFETVPVEGPYSDLSDLSWISDRRRLPALLRRLSADLYHSPEVYAPIVPRSPSVATLYDYYHFPLFGSFDLFSRRYGAGWNLLFRSVYRYHMHNMRRFSRIVCISESTMKDAVGEGRFPGERTTFVHLGVDEAFSPASPERREAARESWGAGDCFILHVGGMERRKNGERIIEVIAGAREKTMADIRLVLAGYRPGSVIEVEEAIDNKGLRDAVLARPDIDDETLAAFYSAADLMLFPSLAEGFGLPVLEAMACGCPVVTSDRKSLPEVAGGSALIVDPEDTENMISAVTDLVTRPELAESLREKGFSRARRFTWAETARKYLEIYEKAGATG